MKQQPEYIQRIIENMKTQAEISITVNRLKVHGDPNNLCNFSIRYLFDEESVILDTDYGHPKYGATGKWHYSQLLEVLEILKKQVVEYPRNGDAFPLNKN